MIRLYQHVDCPFSQKVRIVLAEKDLEFETAHVDLHKGEQRTPEFLKLNPYGKVPVLIDEDIVIYDSTIINEYLDEEYPNPGLMPGDSAGRARVRLLEDFADNSFVPPSILLLAELHKPEGERDPEKVRRYAAEMSRVLGRLEPQLEDRQFLGGEFSLADVAFTPRAVILGKLGVEVDPRLQNVTAWIARLRERSSVKALGL